MSLPYWSAHWGQVVTKDVPERAIVYGSPARIRGIWRKTGQSNIPIQLWEESSYLSYIVGNTFSRNPDIYMSKIALATLNRKW
ncbi:hypothetical protein AKJ44_01690 [candidate division MSBL1 archaeon SCGC-AAA261F17]|uniref:Uncharacterized protein n=1 Tax=candidate division MSBL1 archaeon SCGC-AAA261F17 TaxID=1698274 RepID=A0A133V6C7_9EURY|nr:hypothetical protein AKJ44_01690 [candidate division MSBL1 archaeon SCGC-AAA261F17]